MIGVGLALLVAAAAGPAAGALDVHGETACPTAPQVSAALAGLVAPTTPPAAPDVVELVGQGRGNEDSAPVSVRLWSADKRLVAERRLPDVPSCEERARTAAVIVAAWESHLRAGAAPMWPQPALPATTIATTTTTPPATTAAPAPVAAGTPAAPPDPIQIETSAALLASVAAGGVSPAAMLEGRFSRRDSQFAVGIGALAVSTHAMTLAAGRGTWRRFGGIVDLQSGASWQTVDLQLVAGLALTTVSIMGESLPVTSGASLFDPGAFAGLRLRLRGARLSPWIEAAAAFWPRPHSLVVAGSMASGDLPAIEAFLGLGITLGQNR